MLRHGIIYWDNLVSSGKIFTLEKKLGRITVGAIPGISCRSVLKKRFRCCQYIYSLNNCILNNQEYFQRNYFQRVLIGQ
jgi:hypothetical protein